MQESRGGSLGFVLIKGKMMCVSGKKVIWTVEEGEAEKLKYHTMEYNFPVIFSNIKLIPENFISA